MESASPSPPSDQRSGMPSAPPTPSTAWNLVSVRDTPLRQAAAQLGVPVPELLVLLTAHTPAPKPPARPIVAAAKTRGRQPGDSGRRIDVLAAWRLAEGGASAAQISSSMGFTRKGITDSLAREAARRGCLPPTDFAPQPPTTAEVAWSLVHTQGLDVRTVGRRMGLRPPQVLELLAARAPVVRERESRDLELAGAAPDGRADWTAQRDAHLRSRVSALVGEGLPVDVIRERLGRTAAVLASLSEQVRRGS